MYLYGASGHAKVVIHIAEALNIPIQGLFDDNEAISQLLNYSVYPSSSIQKNMEMIISIGNNEIRSQLAQKYQAKYISLIHPCAIVSSRAMIGEGTVIMQGAVLQVEVEVGNHSIINTACSIDHECKIANFVHISPNSTLCGNVQVGEGSWIGAGTIILPGVKIGKWCTIGAGSVVSKDIPDYSLAVGNRCKILKTLK